MGRADVDMQVEWARFGFRISITHGVSRNHIAYWHTYVLVNG